MDTDKAEDSTGAASAGAPVSFVPKTVTVYTRHSLNCKDRAKGKDWRKCKCMKWLYIYEGGGANSHRQVSAKTRSWEKAEDEAQNIRDSWNPEKQELKRLRAEKERQQVRLEEAVALFHADQVARLGDNGTVAMSRSLFGHVDLKTKTVTKDGHFFAWRDSFNARKRSDVKLAYIADLRPEHLTEWRSSWDFGDLTRRQRWTMVRGFFHFCEAQGWIADDPTRKLKQFEAAKGSRTAIFSDEQYQTILDAVPLYDPENVPELTRQNWQERLTAFLELLRWSGMAIIDAVLYNPALVDEGGVLRYRRRKSHELAIVPLPDHVLVLLRDLPLERDSVGDSQPFRTHGVDEFSDVRCWQHRLGKLFELAGITEVKTELGKMRKPHPHMLRDTFAVWNIVHGVPLPNVSRMLGHAKTSTTEQSYLPWVKAMDQAHIDNVRKAHADIVPKPEGKLVSISAKKGSR